MNDDYSAAEPAPDLSATPRPPGATWGPVALVVVTFIVALVPLAAFLSGSETSDDEIERGELIASGLISIFWYSGIAAIVYWAAKLSGGGWRNLGLRPPSFAPGNVFDSVRNWIGRTLRVWPPRMAVVPIVGYLMAYLCVFAYNIVTVIIGLDSLEPDQQVPPEVFQDGVVITVIGLGILVAAPLVEELFFRGFLFGGLRRYISFWPAALASGFVFSLAHQDLGLIIPFTLVGMVLAYTYEKTGTLYGSISVHFVFNLVSFALLLLVPEFRE